MCRQVAKHGALPNNGCQDLVLAFYPDMRLLAWSLHDFQAIPPEIPSSRPCTCHLVGRSGSSICFLTVWHLSRHMSKIPPDRSTEEYMCARIASPAKKRKKQGVLASSHSNPSTSKPIWAAAHPNPVNAMHRFSNLFKSSEPFKLWSPRYSILLDRHVSLHAGLRTAEV